YIDSAVAKSTRAKYVQNFTTHILPALGSLPIDAVTQDRMETFIALLVKKAPHVRKSDGATDAESERVTLAKATIETIVSNLRKFFNHARKRKLIADNPACGL